jgi:hypothetical protein
LDRLPWLADESDLPPRRSARDFVGLAILLALAVAGASYWLGLRQSGGFAGFDGKPGHRSTLALPEAREVQPDAAPLSEEPRVSPMAQPPVPAIETSRVVTIVPPPRARQAPPKPMKAPPQPKVEPVAPTYSKVPWPVRDVEGASGRLVRIGTFSTRSQAKRGWRVLVRNNPSLQRLPALVVAAPSSRDGKTYYRLQMGTTSQAHSAVLCQRMRMIGQSCVILAEQASGA